MISTEIPIEANVRLLLISNDLQAILSVTELRLFQLRRHYGIG